MKHKPAFLLEDDLKILLHTRPWVNGDKFIGPSLEDLLRAYYTSQGERGAGVEKFTQDHITALNETTKRWGWHGPDKT